MAIRSKDSYTPMMRQYFDIKDQYPDAIVFYRLGDFYEMFFDDAKTASRELELTLTGRDCGQKERAPMCGIPFHSSESYIARLVSKGYKVAVCEQVEDASLTKGLVRRDVIRVLSPGTVTEDSMLQWDKNNFICSMYMDKDKIGMAFCDISTGELFATDLQEDDNFVNELSRFMPREILVCDNIVANEKMIGVMENRFMAYITQGGGYFSCNKLEDNMAKFFGAEGIVTPVNKSRLSTVAMTALLLYVSGALKHNISHIRQFEHYHSSQYMSLDNSTKRNLELVQTMQTGDKRGSLLWVLDNTLTSMGARMLRKWLERPLIHQNRIVQRQQGVGEFATGTTLRQDLRDALEQVRDIERLITRVMLGRATPRDLLALGTSCARLPRIKTLLGKCESPILQKCCAELDTLDDIAGLVTRAIKEDPPIVMTDGDIIRDGYDSQIDQWREAATQGKAWIQQIAEDEREKTGIKTMKVGYNRVFGYYLEVSKGQTDRVPDYFQRKQTLTNGERYFTPELKRIEEEVLGAKERLVQGEYHLFCSIRESVGKNYDRAMHAAHIVATLDCLAGLGETAVKYRYVCPVITEDSEIDIREGRHPVVERLSSEMFVPNDTFLNGGEDRLLLITGPNMAGKSTYMRQVALITLMAQIGSFVPAKEATIGMADKIFTRVGASDDLSAGQSTFMVEMSEVATILVGATDKSLIIYDEIGRGTSTYDGLAIAWSVLEYTLDKKACGARTLFATHYHELTALEQTMEGVKNYHVEIKQRGEDIIFLRKIVHGGASDSYGVEVAQLAGVPMPVIGRAKEILADLEAGNVPVIEKDRPAEKEPSNFEKIMADIGRLDINTITPIEAMSYLYQLKTETEKP